MTDIDIEKVITDLRRIALSSNEKREIKASVFERINKKEFAEGSVVSPFSGILLAARSHAIAFAVMVLVIFAGTGMSVAAEDSLPGDSLYGIKIYLNENLRTAIALNPSQKAHWNSRRAERRLEEAQKLASEGRLTDEVEGELERRFSSHALDAYSAIQDLEQRDDLDAAITAISGLESLISAHQEILSNQLDKNNGLARASDARTQKEFSQLRNDQNGNNIENDSLGMGGDGDVGIMMQLEGVGTSSEGSGNEEVRQNITAVSDEIKKLNKTLEGGLLRTLQNNLNSISENRTEVESRLNQMNALWLKNTTLHTQRKAETAQAVLKKLYTNSSPVLSSGLDEGFQQTMGLVEDLMQDGENYLRLKDYPHAITTFNEAYRLANKTRIIISSYAELGNSQDRKADIDESLPQETDEYDVLGTTTREEEFSTSTNEQIIDGLDGDLPGINVDFSGDGQPASNVERLRLGR
jgi:tetratricopeptide (TPR) repeat protein